MIKNRDVIHYERMEKLMMIITETMIMNCDCSHEVKETLLEAIKYIMEDKQ